MRMKRIKLTEDQFNKLVSESIKKCIKQTVNEMRARNTNTEKRYINYRSFDRTGDGFNEPYTELVGDKIYGEVE